MPSPFRALVVDFGGVLTSSITTSFAAFCLATGVRPEALRDLLAEAYASPAAGDPGATGTGGPSGGPSLAELVVAVETGALPGEEFDRHLAAALSAGLATPLDHTELTPRLFEKLQPDERMLEAVHTVRRHGLKTGLISNTWGGGATPPDSVEKLFDVRILSAAVGLRKPQPEIYRLAASRLEVEPEACVFVDDIPSNVEGARAVGMTGVLHRDAAITIPKLEALLGFSLSP